jgi:RNA polymerase sigma-70 factor (ECF subfamily)
MDTVQCNEQWTAEGLIMQKYDKYKNMLFQITMSYLGNKYDCEDVIQEAFIRLCYYAPEFEEDENEKRWLIRITINLCKNHVKSFWNRMKVPIEGLYEYYSQENEKEIMSDIIHLPIKYKSIILLHYIEGYKISEISKILNLSESAVKMRLKRGRERLKIEMEEET